MIQDTLFQNDFKTPLISRLNKGAYFNIQFIIFNNKLGVLLKGAYFNKTPKFAIFYQNAW